MRHALDIQAYIVRVDWEDGFTMRFKVDERALADDKLQAFRGSARAAHKRLRDGTARGERRALAFLAAFEQSFR